MILRAWRYGLTAAVVVALVAVWVLRSRFPEILGLDQMYGVLEGEG